MFDHGNTKTPMILATALVISSLVLGYAIKDIRKSDRYVTVKGLVERDVEANLAVWPLQFRVSGDDLSAAQTELERQQQAARSFLMENGFAAEEITGGTTSVSDKLAQEYGEVRPGQPRYILQSSLLLRTEKVDAAFAISQRMSDLIKQGVALKEESCTTGPSYLFTKLNELKPDMLAEATRNARVSAEQFAKDSGSVVGGIRQANQGVFSIAARDATSENQDGGGGCGQGSSQHKRVRVVTTIDYYLKD